VQRGELQQVQKKEAANAKRGVEASTTRKSNKCKEQKQ
jgi:hypothetical protein